MLERVLNIRKDDLKTDLINGLDQSLLPGRIVQTQTGVKDASETSALANPENTFIKMSLFTMKYKFLIEIYSNPSLSETYCPLIEAWLANVTESGSAFKTTLVSKNKQNGILPSQYLRTRGLSVKFQTDSCPAREPCKVSGAGVLHPGRLVLFRSLSLNMLQKGPE
jgi:hypothetical protein